MIDPPLPPEKRGTGRKSREIRVLRRIVIRNTLVGAGVSRGPLGTTIRAPRGLAFDGGTGGAAYYA